MYVYIYVCVHIYMRLDDAFFVYFSFLWYSLPSVVSHIIVCMLFFTLHIFICKVMAFLYGVFHCGPHSVLTCDASILFLHQSPDLCIGSRSTALSTSMHMLLNMTIRQMLLYSSPITYSSPPSAHFSFFFKHCDTVGEFPP